MPSAHPGYAPNVDDFIKTLKSQPVETAIENLISLLKRRQIKNSKPCARATAHLLRHVVVKFHWTNVGKLLERVKEVGRRLVEAQPREMVVGNIVRRVLGLIRDEADESREDISDSAPNSQLSSPRPQHSEVILQKAEGITPSSSRLRFETSDSSNGTGDTDEDDVFGNKLQGLRPPLVGSHSTYAGLTGTTVQKSMFDLLAETPSPSATPPGTTSPHGKASFSALSLSQRMSAATTDLKDEVIEGITEIIDELAQVDDQIAAYALDHIHSNEVILTHSSSKSVQKFLLKAAEKRKFTVVVAESFPNDHVETHQAITEGIRQDHESNDSDSFLKALAAAGVKVVLIADSSIFNIMSRVNKVILATHAVIANGGLVAAAGARIIAKAAKVHQTPVIVVSGVYKLSPEYPFEFESLIEYGYPGSVVSYDNGDLVENLEIDNPLYDFVPPDLVDLYITNLGAHAPSYLYRIVADHYKTEDINFHKPELQF